MRHGLSLSTLTGKRPHGVRLADNLAAGALRTVVVYRNRRVHLRHPEIEAEVAALTRRTRPDGYPLRGVRGEDGADPGMTRVGSPSTAIQQAELTRQPRVNS